MSADIDTLEYALHAIDLANVNETNAVRAWARDYMTTSLRSHLATVPADYQGAHVGALQVSQQPVALAKWLRSASSQTLFLPGRTGTGKTWASWALVTQSVIDHLVAASRNIPSTVAGAALAPVPDLLDDLRNDGRSPGYWERVRDVPLLALDDLGAARATPWALERMWSLVNHRTSHRLKTIVTTNLDWTTLVAEWGEPLMDRLRNRSTTVEMVGASLRRVSEPAIA